MEAIAERDQNLRPVTLKQRGKCAERRRGVVGRQQHAARRIARAFFEMQIGNDQQALLRPVQRARRIGDQRHARDVDHVVRCLVPCALPPGSPHPIASLIRSSAASASSTSDASPGTGSRPISSITGTASGETRSSGL